MREMWNIDRRKAQQEHESAVKIQKVFRGFMTRKLLQRYIEEYEEKLMLVRSHLRRKATFHSNSQEDSFYASELKHSYFLSNKKAKSRNRIDEEEEGDSL
jgi:hypothetical protein